MGVSTSSLNILSSPHRCFPIILPQAPQVDLECYMLLHFLLPTYLMNIALPSEDPSVAIRRKQLELIHTRMGMTDGFNLTAYICISPSTQTMSYQSFIHTTLTLTNVRPRLQIDGIGVKLEI